MRQVNRKVTPKVVDGRVQKKNRQDESPSIWTASEFTFEKERPGKGYFHILNKRDVMTFIDIIPDWPTLAKGLRGVCLTEGGFDYDGLYYHAGLICIPAWERDLWRSLYPQHFQAHRALFDRIGVPHEKESDGCWKMKFTIETARAYQLLHVFLHELGHHVDRMNTRGKHDCPRGEPFADAYAFEHEPAVWEQYEAIFGVLPGTAQT